MFKTRLISSLILFPLVVTLIFFLSIVNLHVMMIIICMISAWEWSGFVKIIKQKQRIYISITYGFFLTLISLIILNKNTFFILQIKNIFLLLNFWWIIALFLVIFYPKSSIFWKNSKILNLTYGALIITSFFLGITILREYNYEKNHFTGSWLLLFLVILICSFDSGSYIFGKLFGKHNMVPKISPHKTWEGFIGGLILSIIIFYFILLKLPIIKIPKLYIFICFFSIIFFGLLGDLTESMFKRSANIKNSSNIIPGHGGILDRIDSLTSAISIFTYLILILN